MHNLATLYVYVLRAHYELLYVHMYDVNLILCRCLSDDVKQLTSVNLPYSCNVIKSFLVYLYTNAPPLSALNQNSKESPELTDAELTDLAQLAKEFGLPQLVHYCNLPRDASLQLEIGQPPSDVSEMFQHFGLEMDRTCFYISFEHHFLNEEALAEGLSAKKQVSPSSYTRMHMYIHTCTYTHRHRHRHIHTTHTDTHMHTHTHVFMHVFIHVYILIIYPACCVQLYGHAYIHVHLYT